MVDQSRDPAGYDRSQGDEEAWRITAIELDTFWRTLGHAADSGNRIYNILATSLVLLNGGGLTVIVSAIGTTQLTDAISGAQSLPVILSLLVKLFSVSLIFTLLGLVAGRFADDAAADCVKLDKTAFPLHTYIDDSADRRRELWRQAAYIFTTSAVAAALAALIVVAHSI